MGKTDNNSNILMAQLNSLEEDAYNTPANILDIYNGDDGETLPPTKSPQSMIVDTVINDNTAGYKTTYSSKMIEEKISQMQPVDPSDFDIKDLSDSENLRGTWSAKQDALVAGTNITIEGNTISANAEGVTYHAGDRITIDSSNTISADSQIDDTDSAATATTYSASKIETELGKKSDKTVIVDMTSGSTVSTAITPNKMYMFGTKTSIAITSLTAGESGVVNEYMFQFTSSSTATTLSVPSTVKWITAPNIKTNKKYAVSIENNLGIIGEWNNG